MLKQFPTVKGGQLIFIHCVLVSSLSHADCAQPDHQSYEDKQAGCRPSQQASLFPSRRYTYIPGKSRTLTPLISPPPCSPVDNCSDSNGLKMTLFSNSFFFSPFSWLLISFHAGWKASQTPTPCTYHSGQDTQEVYVLCRGEGAEGGSGEGKERGMGRWCVQEKKS